ncbi:hypothetical protein AUEXF2481DRAFT_202389 [Aureobasidium subglaciale EXF-2481]|uniref:Uncharacterized protein n=1 Tax=Aureobasidium subglaciale (strain EXF-2481) TaxID=1043005 RepID=A0A074YQC9_AURSE|nr:uncharacterized protein AUEXF2481DRAFT_202389 [Aureobasidium subglaciale EXF-2481]KEQ99895.1 hypothetical protein AUEXF2481DRAFT_202389 [Aureobasidium subglaciale EXF-2481]
MEVSHPDIWPSLATIFDLMVSACLTCLESVKHAARAIGPSIWVALHWLGHSLSVAGNVLLAAILILLLWISVIYLCCFTIFMFCKLVRRQQKHRSRGERQPLLPAPSRRRRLPSWTSSNSSSERRRHHDHQAHRDLFRVEISRRRQDTLRREQHRAVETRCREYRERRLREAIQQSTSTPLYAQHQTIITWLHASTSTTVIPNHPNYGTLPNRNVTSRPGRADPPPPYSQNTREQPPPYANQRNDRPPAYD